MDEKGNTKLTHITKLKINWKKINNDINLNKFFFSISYFFSVLYIWQ